MNTDVLTALERYYEQDLLTAVDIEFCRFLLQVDESLDLAELGAACLTSTAYQDGDVCILLEEYAGQPFLGEETSHSMPMLDQWRSALLESTIVGTPGQFKPLILDQANRLYLHKLWRYEKTLAEQLLHRVEKGVPDVNRTLLADGLQRMFDTEEPVDWQRIAAIMAVHRLVTVISGGPGTGKTTTVVRLLALLIEQAQARGAVPSIALAAPTGKAAGRLEASIRETRKSLPVKQGVKECIPTEAVTIHQLLGARRNTSKFRHNADNPLPYNCVIIDEVSMVDQTLMSRLTEALLPETRLILLGDKDQLASVEAGSVLGDICGSRNTNLISEDMAALLNDFSTEVPAGNITADPGKLTDHIILLQKSYRFGDESGIGKLSAAINAGDAKGAVTLLKDDQYSDVSIQSCGTYREFEDVLTASIKTQLQQVREKSEPIEKLAVYQRFKILAAHRRGPWGAEQLNARIERRLQQMGLIPAHQTWYEGRPVIIHTNNYNLGLSNGDMGVCLMDSEHKPVICFPSDEGVFTVRPARLPSFSASYVMTVHKSQGSEFDHILLALPDEPSKILSRELLYTGVTRARKQVQILGRPSVVKNAIAHIVARNSGLKDYFWN